MAAYFVDSSALVKRYRQEAGTERIAAVLDSAERIIIARLTQVEVTAAVIRRGRTAAVPAQDIERALTALDQDILNSFDVVELNAEVISQAIDLTRRHALRAADAIQLSCALFARTRAQSSEFFVLSSDQELNSAAAGEGLQVIDPSQ
jgi:predicted nucleic acid-binding protein